MYTDVLTIPTFLLSRRMWKSMSLMGEGVDCTWGVCDFLEKLLCISSIELETPEGLQLDMTPGRRRRQVESNIRNSLVKTQDLRANCIFQREVETHAEVPVLLVGLYKEGLAAATNEAHNQLLLSQGINRVTIWGDGLSRQYLLL